MKRTISILTLILAINISFGQVSVKFGINHLVNDEPLTIRSTGENNLANEFTVSRLQYYISEIKIVHDADDTTEIEDKYILVDAFNTTFEDLGEYEIDEVKKVIFSIGVPTPVNNEDPAQWPSEHALAPKFPSMHWGWSAGYRFVAIEGYAGESFGTKYEYHSLGNDYYFTVEMETQAKMVDGSLVIGVNAEYSDALKDLDISKGPILHGEFPDAIKVLENFRDNVFSSANGVVSSEWKVTEVPFSIYPNPSEDGAVIVDIDATDNQLYTIELIDLTGRKVLTITDIADRRQLQIDQAGSYLLQIIGEDGFVGTKHLITR